MSKTVEGVKGFTCRWCNENMITDVCSNDLIKVSEPSAQMLH